jgi:hypothetical protein
VNDEQKKILDAGRKAWASKKADNDWAGWVAIGECLMIGRTVALSISGANEPKGKLYSEEFSKWCGVNKYDDMDPPLRSKLLACMETETRAKIETLRASWSSKERLAINHPQSMLNKIKAHDKALSGEEPKPRKVKDVTEALDDISVEKVTRSFLTSVNVRDIVRMLDEIRHEDLPAILREVQQRIADSRAFEEQPEEAPVKSSKRTRKRQPEPDADAAE